MTSSLTWTGPLPKKESSTTARLIGTPFTLFTLLTRGLQGFQMILPLLLPSMDLFIPSFYKPVEKISPKWFNTQCVKAVNNKDHYFKEWEPLQTQHSRTSFIHPSVEQSRLTVQSIFYERGQLLSTSTLLTHLTTLSFCKIIYSKDQICPAIFNS